MEECFFFFSEPPRPQPPTLDHAQVHLPQLPPAHGGSNGAPRPGLCALLSALWKSAENSGQKHILTRTPDIHLGPQPLPPRPRHCGLRPVSSAQHSASQEQFRLGSQSMHTHMHTHSHTNTRVKSPQHT